MLNLKKKNKNLEIYNKNKRYHNIEYIMTFNKYTHKKNMSERHRKKKERSLG